MRSSARRMGDVKSVSCSKLLNKALRGSAAEKFSQTRWGNQSRRLLQGKPSGLPLRLFWPFAKLALNREQKHGHFAQRALPRVPLFLIPVRAKGLGADDRPDQPRFLIGLPSRSCRG